MSVGAAIGVVASRGWEVDRYLWENDGLERRTGVEVANEIIDRLVGMRRTSLGRVRESMSRFMLICVVCVR